MPDNNYRIDSMLYVELSLAINWAKEAGWNPGLHDAECFYKTDPSGFFVGRLKGKIIAVASAVIYDENFAFCGLYMVDKAYRGKGFGLALTKARLKYIGNRNAGIDGVVHMIDKYKRIGYQIAHYNSRYEFKNKLKDFQHPALIPCSAVSFEKLCAYDRHHFPAPRPVFLRCWINQPGSKSLCYIEDEIIRGFAVIRPCISGYKIGPLFADRPEFAELLFASFSFSGRITGNWLTISR